MHSKHQNTMQLLKGKLWVHKHHRKKMPSGVGWKRASGWIIYIIWYYLVKKNQQVHICIHTCLCLHVPRKKPRRTRLNSNCLWRFRREVAILSLHTFLWGWNCLVWMKDTYHFLIRGRRREGLFLEHPK